MSDFLKPSIRLFWDILYCKSRIFELQFLTNIARCVLAHVHVHEWQCDLKGLWNSMMKKQSSLRSQRNLNRALFAHTMRHLTDIYCNNNTFCTLQGLVETGELENDHGPQNATVLSCRLRSSMRKHQCSKICLFNLGRFTLGIHALLGWHHGWTKNPWGLAQTPMWTTCLLLDQQSGNWWSFRCSQFN